MRFVTPEKISELQKVVDNVRNICILAHVDHGKTTLADSLVASNGIISAKAVGSLRYMDSRPDEQVRGITMKSSSISLLHQTPGQEFLVNLIDSPGHVDFSSEVSTAVRLCDGAIIVVDVVEGVCPQTRIALKQAYLENIKPVLVLNKIDRLILEMQLSPLDAYVHMVQILEQVNAVMGDIFASDIFEKEETNLETKEADSYNWTSALEDVDDSHLYFSPGAGNVVFASAIDGWGFGVDKFAKIFAEKLGAKEDLLKKVIWGDFYLDSKTKRFMKGAQEKAKKPIFVQLVLENIWSLYDTIIVRKERDKVEAMTKKLGINLTTRDLKHRDPKVQLQSVTSQWLPLAESVLNMVCDKLPSPKELSEEKVEKLMCSQNRRFDSLLPETQKLKELFLACDGSEDKPIIVYISKMFPVEKKTLPCYRAKPLTAEEIAHRREIARQRQQARQNQTSSESTPSAALSLSEDIKPEVKDNEEHSDMDSDVFIGFARLFSGKLKKGSEVYVLGPKHDPQTYLGNLNDPNIDCSLTLKDLKNNQHITKIKITQLYLLMGRELEELDEVPAGNILGIGGLDEHVLKTATLSTTIYCPSFTEMTMFAVPIVRVAVETQHPSDMPKLVKGLKLLNQADACVQVLVQETGEHVLLTAGEVHLERCLEDLRTRYAKIPITVSDPIVPFRETIVEPPKIDMVNEDIGSTTLATDENTDKKEDKLIILQTPNKQCTIKLRAVPLPKEVTAILEQNSDILKLIDSQTKVVAKSVCVEDQGNDIGNKLEQLKISTTETSADLEKLTLRSLKAIEQFKADLKNAFESAGTDWSNTVDELWAAGPRKCGPNLLLNRVKGFKKSLFDINCKNDNDIRNVFSSSFLNGFQLATLAGPLCEEPMMGVAFVVEEWTILEDNEDSTLASQPYGPFSGQIMSAVKEGCRKAFQDQPQRLMAAMYSCQISAKAQVLGAMYSVLRRRHAKLLTEETDRLSSSFSITAHLPVLESFRLTDELRKQTSGLATMQLVFSHFEVIEIDPFWTPSTESEYVHFGEKADSANRAKKYMDAVRRRKGLQVDDKIVEFAEKQRTLSKNK